VFQGFSKFNTSVQENVGIGSVEKLAQYSSIETALHLAEADAFVESLPHGLQTTLDTTGFESLSYPGMRRSSLFQQHHGLSGGEVCA
jgi:ABC-type multidrug transport system fused ATPase/permease subunit